MEKRITVKELYAGPKAFSDKEVTVMGWARTIRDSKAFAFIELNDGSCFKNCKYIIIPPKRLNSGIAILHNKTKTMYYSQFWKKIETLIYVAAIFR